MTFDDLSKWLIDYVAAYPDKYDQRAIWGEPIMACARVDDRFQRLKAGKKCGKCIKACPVDALYADGMDRTVCYARLRENYHLLMEPDGLPETTDVCAKCQVGMPCSLKSPLPIEKN